MSLRLALALSCLFATVPSSMRGQQNAAGPTAGHAAAAATSSLWALPVEAKAQKSYEEGLDLELHHRYSFALDSYKKADKQDGNRCAACAHKVLELATGTGDFKLADAAAQELLGLATTSQQQARAHVERAQMLRTMAKIKKKPECVAEGVREAESALVLQPGNVTALYVKGMCLADEQQDQAAKEVFTMLLPKLPPHSVDHDRVTRYVERPELVRARMAPAFAFTTIDGKRISLDELQNKVVLIDFWATWCGPCREALPHMRKIAKQFEGQSLVVLSISLDSDEQKWKEFVGKNEMTWLQARDGGFTGPISQLFEVRSIPHTFTIDSDGVLQDEHVGDGNIEGKLKKLIAQAQQREQMAKTAQVASSAPVGGTR